MQFSHRENSQKNRYLLSTEYKDYSYGQNEEVAISHLGSQLAVGHLPTFHLQTEGKGGYISRFG